MLKEAKNLAHVWENTARSACNNSIDDSICCCKCGTKPSSHSNLLTQRLYTCCDVRCGHMFCEKCKGSLLFRKSKFPCPKCGTIITEALLSLKNLDETEVEKDIGIRRNIKGIYNKSEKDFSCLREFCDYEEMVEDIIFSLVHDINKAEVLAEVERYKLDQSHSIEENALRLLQATDEIERQIAKEIAERTEHHLQNFIEEEQLLADKIQQHTNVNAAMLGEGNIKVQVKSKQAVEDSATVTHTQTYEASAITKAFFAQRLDPKPLIRRSSSSTSLVSDTDMGAALAATVTHSARDKRAMHSAGGYTHASYSRRNWQEFITSLQSSLLVQATDTLHLHDTAASKSSSSSMSSTSSLSSSSFMSSSITHTLTCSAAVTQSQQERSSRLVAMLEALKCQSN